MRSKQLCLHIRRVGPSQPRPSSYLPEKETCELTHHPHIGSAQRHMMVSRPEPENGHQRGVSDVNECAEQRRLVAGRKPGTSSKHYVTLCISARMCLGPVGQHRERMGGVKTVCVRLLLDHVSPGDEHFHAHLKEFPRSSVRELAGKPVVP